MVQATEVFIAITAFVMGLSHLLRPQVWSDVYTALGSAGRPGAFINGAIHLIPGAIIIAGHWVWTSPQLVLTILGCLLVAKGTVCFLLPEVALKSIALSRRPMGFRVAGIICLAIAAWAIYCLCQRA